jgi:hypothetical protein
VKKIHTNRFHVDLGSLADLLYGAGVGLTNRAPLAKYTFGDAGTITFNPGTREKCRRLKVATALPRSMAVAATIRSWAPIISPEDSRRAQILACTKAVAAVYGIAASLSTIVFK